MGHPEDFCQRCGRPNLHGWHAPSPLWNAVMRREDGSDEWDIVCPQCFVAVAEERGVIDRAIWCLRPDKGVVVPLAAHTEDGRQWNAEKCLWVEA